MEYEQRTWIDDIIEHTIANYNGRTIVLWGKHGASEEIRKRLIMQYRIENILYVDSDKRKQNGRDVFEPNYIRNKKNSMYIVIPITYYAEVTALLHDGGYVEEIDYYYFCACIKEQTWDYYEDAHGNKVYGERGGAHFIFLGYNNVVRIGKGTIFKDCRISLQNNTQMTIGSNGIWDNGRITICDNGVLEVGNDFTIGPDYRLAVVANTKISIGNDCMFSWHITFLTNDGHAIFDRITGKRINDVMSKGKIQIGNHVWIGANGMILYDTLIEDGSVVGANSLVKGSFPANCVLAGDPAKLIREDIVWCRDNDVTEYFGEDNFL